MQFILISLTIEYFNFFLFLGIRALYAAREAEIMSIGGGDERWENWLQFTQSRLVPKFTEVSEEYSRERSTTWRA